METKLVDLSGDLCYSTLSLCEESTEKREGVLCSVGGTFMELEKKGENGRFYPAEIADVIIKSPYTVRNLKYKTLFGEPHHPPDERYSIWMDESSHCVTELSYDPNTKTIQGKADILDTPKGRIMNTLVRYGSTLGISARSYGQTYRRDGIDYVDPDTYTFKTFDFTTNPGFLAARVSTLNEEQQEEFKSSLKSLLEECDDVGAINIVKDFTESCGYGDVVACADQRLSSIQNTLELESQKKIKELEARTNDLAEIAHNHEMRISDLNHVVNVSKAALQSKEEELREAGLRITFLEDKLVGYVNLCSTLQETVESLDKELTQRNLDSQSMQEALGSLKGANQALTVENTYLKEASESLENRITKLLSTVRELRSVNQECEVSLGNAEARLQEERDLSAELRTKESLVTKQQNKIDSISNELSSLKEKHSSLKEEHDSLVSELASLKEENQKLSNLTSEQKTLIDNQSKLISDITLNEEAEDLNEEVKVMPSVVDSPVVITAEESVTPVSVNPTLERMLHKLS